MDWPILALPSSTSLSLSLSLLRSNDGKNSFKRRGVSEVRGWINEWINDWRVGWFCEWLDGSVLEGLIYERVDDDWMDRWT